MTLQMSEILLFAGSGDIHVLPSIAFKIPDEKK
jgi:hypothetical protein